MENLVWVHNNDVMGCERNGSNNLGTALDFMILGFILEAIFNLLRYSDFMLTYTLS